MRLSCGPSKSWAERAGRRWRGQATARRRRHTVLKKNKQTFPIWEFGFLVNGEKVNPIKMGEIATNNLILVTNIAPQATRDQMNTLFSFVGRVEELKLYPSVRDASINVDCRCCFVRFSDPTCVPITQHLNNTVFIDRAIIITPVIDNVIPDETIGIILSQRVQNQQQQSGGGGVVGVKGDTGEVEGPATAESAGTADAGEFQDPRLEAAGLPPYPALPPDTPAFLVNEIRRSVAVINVDSTVSAQQCMEFFSTEAGEVKFFRYCTRNNDPLKYALIEFSERTSVVPAMLMSGRQLGNSVIQVTHAIEAIAKPQAKSNEAAQREIEEAMTKVKEAQSLVSAAVDPIMGILGGGSGGVSARSSRTRSRSRSRSRRRSRDRSRGRSSYSSRRSRSRESRRRRSRSRERRRRSRSRDRHRRSRSRESRRKRSKSRERHRRSRSKSRDRDRKSRKKEEEKEDQFWFYGLRGRKMPVAKNVCLYVNKHKSIKKEHCKCFGCKNCNYKLCYASRCTMDALFVTKSCSNSSVSILQLLAVANF